MQNFKGFQNLDKLVWDGMIWRGHSQNASSRMKTPLPLRGTDHLLKIICTTVGIDYFVENSFLHILRLIPTLGDEQRRRKSQNTAKMWKSHFYGLPSKNRILWDSTGPTSASEKRNILDLLVSRCNLPFQINKSQKKNLAAAGSVWNCWSSGGPSLKVCPFVQANQKTRFSILMFFELLIEVYYRLSVPRSLNLKSDFPYPPPQHPKKGSGVKKTFFCTKEKFST